MKIIKFRGQRTDNKKWVYGNLMSSSYLPDNILECFIITCFSGGDEGDIIEKFKVIPETVGQYIGRKDKNGTDIYKGDIINWICIGKEGGNTEDIGIEKDMGNSEVFFEECKFMAFTTIPVGHFDTEEIEVIGNKHNNKELL